MSRLLPVMLALLFCTGNLFRDFASAQAPAKGKRNPVSPHEQSLEVMQLLQQPIKTKGLHEKVKLKQALEYLSDKFAGKLVILINQQAFEADKGKDDPDIYEQEIQLPSFPETMTVQTALRFLLPQLGKGKATYMIRSGHIEITSIDQNRAQTILASQLIANYEERPLKAVLQDLSAQTGLVINLDPRVAGKAATPISATFRMNVLEDALVTVTELADLKFVVLYNSVLVTTAERAKMIQKEESKRAKKHAPIKPGTRPLVIS